MPLAVDPTLPPGTWTLRSAYDGKDTVSKWPRIKLPGIPTLAEALKQIGPDFPVPSLAGAGLPSRDFREWLAEQKWFTTGISTIDQLRTQCAPSLLKHLSWRMPPRLLPVVSVGDAQIYGVPVVVEPGLPPGATPYLAFDLEEKNP
jgi:hypothetical protein